MSFLTVNCASGYHIYYTHKFSSALFSLSHFPFNVFLFPFKSLPSSQAKQLNYINISYFLNVVQQCFYNHTLVFSIHFYKQILCKNDYVHKRVTYVTEVWNLYAEQWNNNKSNASVMCHPLFSVWKQTMHCYFYLCLRAIRKTCLLCWLYVITITESVFPANVPMKLFYAFNISCISLYKDGKNIYNYDNNCETKQVYHMYIYS